MTERQMIDVSDSSGVALCSCGWRTVVPADKGQAWRIAYEHGRAMHPGDNTDHARWNRDRWGER